MSLKPFHIVLISAAILLGLGLGIWGLRDHAAGGGKTGLEVAAASFVTAFALLVYLFKFLRRMKQKGW